MQQLEAAPAALTIQEVSEALRVSPRHINRLISARRLASVQVGRCRRIRPEALREFLQEHERLAR